MLGRILSKLQKKRVLLHIGLPKCGSSSLQAYMADRAKAHHDMGVCYPTAHRLRSGYRNHLPLAQMAPDELPRALKQIEAEAQGCHTIVLSCEHWTNALHICNLASLCTELRRIMPNRTLHVVAYFRSPFDFADSCYAQFIRAGLMGVNRPEFYADGAPSIERFLHRFEILRGYPLWSIKAWCEEIRTKTRGARLSLRSMEPGDLPAENFISDFCALAGVAPPATMPKQNLRLSNRKLAELEYAQTLIDNDSHMAARDRMIAHDFGRHHPNDTARIAGLNIGADTAQAIERTLKAEKSKITQLFATRTTRLCAVPVRDWHRRDLLTADDKAQIARYVGSRQRGAA